MVETMENVGEQLPQNHGVDDLGVAVAEKRWPGWPGESVFRLLVPAQKVGGIIGRKGEFIKKMTEESKARIKILDGPPGTPERAVMVSAKEEQDASLPPAIDGLLRVHKRVIDGLDDETSNAQTTGVTVSTRLLAAGSQAGSLIGRQGTTVKSIQEASDCIVRVLGAEDLPAFALPDDRIIEIQGHPAGVHKAVELIASHLRKFLVDRSVLPLYENHMTMANPHLDRNMPHPYWGYPRGTPPNPGASGFGGNPPFMPPGPQRQHDNYYPSSDLPPLDKQMHHGFPAFGRDVPLGVNPSTNAQLPPPQMISQVTRHMQIPLSYADAVIGTDGATISYIRRASDAAITIQETRGVPGEMTVEINGTATQVQTAQQLIQNFMAEAAAPTQNQGATQPSSWQNAVGYADPGYNSFQAHGSMYASPPSNAGPAGGNAGHTGGGYGPAGGNAGHIGGGYGPAGGNAGHMGGGYGSAGGNAGQTGGAYASVYGSNYGY